MNYYDSYELVTKITSIQVLLALVFGKISYSYNLWK